ncbi:uncharacterized protein TrAFT101_004858 [Trichoderma asperellum]|uniref:Uncharacterized protein n=1 Tax=Trichoderma asperellum (strain ATCC 204424 / CBS 433.97 / NBRC 101777) TaxID=1042311 RepID=A0A2T3Z5L7_TRIA4|nr:hypothetical protein M441DRAFT_141711 [Trichoderma asperellum CBS 433.97]PTB40103.1 hypothetical protein M441DRAFT_141711 [Trichoderma asperellum CBS 433.97]UKZ89816.1 hypothetical protein TrAFT101_004858 [Trichoderma asperellum]
MSQRPVTRLVIPTQSSSPNSQPTTPNGRPSAWSWSAQRKMARLYLYTTLPAEKIRAIINAHSPDKTIKQSSANKKLQSFFDKEPRWLHPHDNEDMGRRITELANSPTQIQKASEMYFSSVHLGPQDHPSLYGKSDFLGVGASPSACSDSIYSSSDAFSESQMSLPCAMPDVPGESPGESSRGQVHSVDDSQDSSPFIPFLERTTFMTESSARTTGTFRDHLQEYTEPYIKVVKRLVKRFTSPALDQPSPSPQQDMRVDPSRDWIGESTRKIPDAPKDFLVLPGYFISHESFASVNASEILTAWRYWWGCHPTPDKFFWLTPDGLTALANDVLSLRSIQFDDMPCDCFANTALHFLGIWGNPEVLCRALQMGTCTLTINMQNTAGQTFMHLLNPSNGWNQQLVLELVRIAQAKGFDLFARDCLGQSSLHVLKRLNLFPYEWNDIGLYDFLVRDGFGCIPVNHKVSREVNSNHKNLFNYEKVRGENESVLIPDPALDLVESNYPEISQESQLLQNIRMSFTSPHWEDEYGHNGLHCLAMATLSLDSLAEKHDMKGEAEQFFSPGSSHHLSDSSTERLQLRLSILESLLDAGQDPNHRDKFGQTPLMAFVAALPEDGGYKIGPAILKLLISKGADIKARNRAGETALHIAVRFHRKLAIRVLTEAGANVHVTDAYGRSLLGVCDIQLAKYSHPAEYGKYLACRAFLSGQAGAVQSPFCLQQWMG